jgi:HSP20 family protein
MEFCNPSDCCWLLRIRAEVKQEKEEKKDEKVVHSERFYGAVARSLQLPVDVDAEKASANYKDGVLNLTLPKKSGAATSRVAIR